MATANLGRYKDINNLKVSYNFGNFLLKSMEAINSDLQVGCLHINQFGIINRSLIQSLIYKPLSQQTQLIFAFFNLTQTHSRLDSYF